jgi:hypothetical protein
MKRCFVLVVLLAACGDDGHSVDAGPTTVTGELVDMESTDSGAFFCGILGATVTVHGDATQTVMTNPNGRIENLTIHEARAQLDITPPADMSQCSQPPSVYTTPATMIVDAKVAASGAVISARMFTMADAANFGFDASKAQVLVHVDGTARAVSITASHAATQAFDGTHWAAGDTGDNVFFPNVDPATGTTLVSMSNGLGAGSIPLTAGAFTFLTVVGQ